MNYQRISEDAYKKLLFQVRGQYIAILNIFRCYGMDAHVDQAIDECMRVTEKFGMAVRGKGNSVHILSEPKRRVTE